MPAVTFRYFWITWKSHQRLLTGSVGPRALQWTARYLESLCFGVHETQAAVEGGVVLVQRVRDRLHLLLGLLRLRLEGLGQLNVGQDLDRGGRTASDQLHRKLVHYRGSYTPGVNRDVHT